MVAAPPVHNRRTTQTLPYYPTLASSESLVPVLREDREDCVRQLQGKHRQRRIEESDEPELARTNATLPGVSEYTPRLLKLLNSAHLLIIIDYLTC